MRAAQFYKIEYTTETFTPGQFQLQTVYERGRANLMRLLGECLSDKKLGSFTVEPVDADKVPESLRKDLERAAKYH